MKRDARGRLVRAPRSVTAYHGCSVEAAQKILDGQPFVRSENTYDWLGAGVYFWEYGPFRAMEWAQRRFGAGAAVIQAIIRLGSCLNLLDPLDFSGLQSAYDSLVDEFSERGVPVPENRSKAHNLDRLIVESYCKKQTAFSGTRYQTVRGCFPEGDPVCPGSRLLRETHVQIAVRDHSCISGVRMVSLEQIDIYGPGGYR